MALGLHNDSLKVADRFLEEALKRRTEVNPARVDLYIQNILKGLDRLSSAEDALMYSTLLQNFVLKRIKIR